MPTRNWPVFWSKPGWGSNMTPTSVLKRTWQHSMWTCEERNNVLIWKIRTQILRIWLMFSLWKFSFQPRKENREEQMESCSICSSCSHCVVCSFQMSLSIFSVTDQLRRILFFFYLKRTNWIHHLRLIEIIETCSPRSLSRGDVLSSICENSLSHGARVYADLCKRFLLIRRASGFCRLCLTDLINYTTYVKLEARGPNQACHIISRGPCELKRDIIVLQL